MQEQPNIINVRVAPKHKSDTLSRITSATGLIVLLYTLHFSLSKLHTELRSSLFRAQLQMWQRSARRGELGKEAQGVRAQQI